MMQQNMRKPSCYAASLIISNRNGEGQILRDMLAIPEQDRNYGVRLAISILQREAAWKEHELWAVA